MQTSVDVALETASFDYPLPAERIAQSPIEPRDAARLLQMDSAGRLEDFGFTDLPTLLQPGDLLVANTTRVRAARLIGRVGGREVELLVLAELGDGLYRCLVRPARQLPAGTTVEISPSLQATVLDTLDAHPGERQVSFHADGDTGAEIEKHGTAPLPPYIHEKLQNPERYQTTYSSGPPLSAAAPTAGLHFTDAVREALSTRGVGWATVELVVGLGTFAPIRAERVDEHRMHEEQIVVSDETVRQIGKAREAGGRIIAVGTTTARALEASIDGSGKLQPRSGPTDLFIRPGYAFKAIDGLLTNFHQPRSSLLVMLSAFVGDSRWRQAYAHALDHGYRFLSFGDCMLCWCNP